jgi:nicotinate-nucleotide adenylyltransferase
MGSDNLVQLPRWRRWESIFVAMPLAVVVRPGTATAARSCLAARRFAFALRPPSIGLAGSRPPAWTILDGRRDPTSATAIRSSTKQHV